MDAYVFSTQATPDAIAALSRSGGPARVVLPVIGSHALVVAVEADDDAGLNQRIAEVIGTDGLGGTTALQATAPGTAFPLPIHAAVDEHVGFCLLATEPGLSVQVYQAATAVAEVVGAAVVTGATYSVLVEATASDTAALSLVLNQVSGLPGVSAAATATGSSGLGFGLTSR